MYILKVGIIDRLFRNIFFLIDDAIYSQIPKLYDLLMSIARTSPLSQASIADMASRIYRLLAVFMMFKVILSLIMYVVNPDDLQDYVVEFVRTILHRDFNKKKICHYIGRKDEETNRMIISNKVQKEIVDEILEPELEKRRSDRNYVVRAMIIANMKKQNEK